MRRIIFWSAIFSLATAISSREDAGVARVSHQDFQAVNQNGEQVYNARLKNGLQIGSFEG